MYLNVLLEMLHTIFTVLVIFLVLMFKVAFIKAVFLSFVGVSYP